MSSPPLFLFVLFLVSPELFSTLLSLSLNSSFLAVSALPLLGPDSPLMLLDSDSAPGLSPLLSLEVSWESELETSWDLVASFLSCPLILLPILSWVLLSLAVLSWSPSVFSWSFLSLLVLWWSSFSLSVSSCSFLSLPVLARSLSSLSVLPWSFWSSPIM